MKNNKILHANSDNFNLGGAFIITYRVEKHLKKYGFSYDYISMDHFVEESNNYAINKEDKTYSANLRKNKLLGHLLLPFYVNKILKKTSYKIIHIDTDSAWKALLYAIPAQKNKVKVIVHSHSTGIDGKSKLLKMFCEFWAKKILIKYCNNYIACSEDAAKWIVPSGYSNIVKIIPNGIDLNEFYFDKNERVKYRKKYNLGNSIVIGNVGLFTENKNQKYLIELLEELLKDNYNVKLLLVGNNNTAYGQTIKKIVEEKKIQEKAILTGPSDDVRQLMNAMDIYIQPSNFEGFCLASLEAQATGLLTYVSNTLPEESIVCDWGKKFNIHEGKKIIKQVISNYSFENNSRDNKKIDERNGLAYMAEQEAQIYKELLQRGKLDENK